MLMGMGKLGVPVGDDRPNVLWQTRHLLPGAAALAGVAGYTNSVMLGFFHAPVSHMTGSLSRLATDSALGQYVDAFLAATIMGGFLVGAILSGFIVGGWKRMPSRRYGVGLMLEGGLLALATYLLFFRERLALPVVALACGLQNAMTTSYCGLLIRTTHVTGMVTDIGMLLGHWLRRGEVEGWKLRFLCAVVGSFGAGSWCGAWANARYGPLCLALVAAGVTVAGGIFWFITHRGLLELMAEERGEAPHTSVFPRI